MKWILILALFLFPVVAEAQIVLYYGPYTVQETRAVMTVAAPVYAPAPVTTYYAPPPVTWTAPGTVYYAPQPAYYPTYTYAPPVYSATYYRGPGLFGGPGLFNRGVSASASCGPGG